MKYRAESEKSGGEVGKESRCCKRHSFMFPVHQKSADVCWQGYSQRTEGGGS